MKRPEPELAVNKEKGSWTFRKWTDGVEQWCPTDYLMRDDNAGKLFVERVVKHNSRRKQWCIVDRVKEPGNGRLYALKISGPFPSLKAAQAAFKLILNH